MIVKIGNKFYDSNDQPIMIILSEKEKTLISNMGDSKKYCSYPENGYTSSQIEFWMKDKK